MNFNSHVDSTLNTLLENTKFLKEMEAVVSELDVDGEYAKLMEDSSQRRVSAAEILIGLKSKHKALDQELRQCSNESTTIEELERNWPQRQEATEKKTTNVKKTTEYKNFKKTVEETLTMGEGVNGGASGEGDDNDIIVEDDMETGGEIFSMYDPWSKALMRNPVRNTHCRHLYDRDSVFAVIKNNIGIRCPVLGCANNKYIQPGHLVRDLKVQKIVRARIAEEAQEQEVSSSEDDDDEN
ncbi:E3 SUMO-protein ligase NSE2-like [Drosophila serrata]|uniref:E3 SUMO-protein ligase NSE2-like n=1 Tax=Drosophila serrata TaxID=7274 RepID=UPI000A1D1F3D|nr:E3 SUMO-protein ligase NSE2-like [Drosophila serrata]KAH8367604.1 hypothetical protein KR200_011125 [Drosophila serrata]